MNDDITIKCDSAEIAAGGFRHPDLEIEATGVLVDEIIDQIDKNEILAYFGAPDLIAYLESEGYTVTESD